MTTIYDRIHDLRLARKMTQPEVAKRLGYTSPSTISRIEAGEIDLPQSKVMAFADLFGVSPSYLIFGTADIGNIKMRGTIPLLGNIACGKPIMAQEHIIDKIALPDGIKADFALRCNGDSMIPTINDGDIVYIRQQPTVENGQIAAVLFYSDAEYAEATLKRIYHQGNILQLVPENRKYDPIFIQGSDANNIMIAGLAVGIHREL